MRLPKFEYREPTTIEEASSMLCSEQGAKIISGGTDLLVNMKHQVETPGTLVNIKRISGLDFIREDSGAMIIGALTPLKKIYRTPLVAEKLPAFAQAASVVGSYHHQTMGTVGGNLCQQNRCMFFNQSRWWRSSRELCIKAGGEVCHVVSKKATCFSTYCGDMAPVLLTLNAIVVLRGEKDSRQIPLSDLYSGDGKAPLTLKQGEILTEVRVPEETRQGFCTYRKFANRGSIDFPIAGASLWASPERKEYRLAYTAIGRGPQRALNTETFLKGKDLQRGGHRGGIRTGLQGGGAGQDVPIFPFLQEKNPGFALSRRHDRCHGEVVDHETGY